MDQVEQVVELIADVVGAYLLGAYLHGSAVLGGLRPASDVDILAVTRRSMDVEQRQALVAGIRPISGAAVGARPVELTVVVQAEVRPWRYPPIGDFLYGEWLRAQYQAGVLPASGPMPGLALEIAVALTGDRPLVGPRPAQVLDAVPSELLVQASVDGISGLLADLPPRHPKCVADLRSDLDNAGHRNGRCQGHRRGVGARPPRARTSAGARVRLRAVPDGHLCGRKLARRVDGAGQCPR